MADQVSSIKRHRAWIGIQTLPVPLGDRGDAKGEKSVEMTNICYVTYEIVKQRKNKNDQNKIFCSIWKLFLSSFNTGRPFCKKKKKSGFRNGYLIYICLSLSFSQNFFAHSSELLKGLKIIQSKISQIPPDYIKTNALLNGFRDS